MYKHKEPYYSLYKFLGYYPNSPQLYTTAFTHKSARILNKDTGELISNERMEFLGDALLDSIVGEILYKRYPHEQEGFLTNMRSYLVRRDTLNKLAIRIGLDKKTIRNNSLNGIKTCVFGNSFEALIAAIYLDQGYTFCYQYVEKLINNFIDLQIILKTESNNKSILMEWGQHYHLEIKYELEGTTENEQGDCLFLVGVLIEDQKVGSGKGRSKKQAEQAAAKQANKYIQTHPDFVQMLSKSTNEVQA